MRSIMVDIYQYSDYRRYLNDYYLEQKKLDKKFSHRYFAQKIGLSSSGYFSDLLKGKKNLTPSLLVKFTTMLKLKRDEAEFFEHLVYFTQAKTIEERNYHYNKMLGFSGMKVQTVDREKFEYYSRWYYPAIRELLYFYKFKDDYEDLAHRLVPQIRVEQARRAIEVLENLGFIARDENGYFKQSTPLLTSGSSVQHFYIANFQAATMDLAREGLDRFVPDIRDYSTITLTFSNASFKAAQKEIEDLRKKLIRLAEKDMNVDRVYQFNCQLFPLTKF